MIKYDEKAKCYYIDAKIKKRDGTYHHFTHKENDNPLFKKKKYVQSIEYEIMENKKREVEYKTAGLKGETLKDLYYKFIETKENELASNTLKVYNGIFDKDFPLAFNIKNSVLTELTPAKCSIYRKKIAQQDICSKRKNVKLYTLEEIITFARKLKLIDSETKDDCLFSIERFKGDIKKQEETNKYTPLKDLEKILNSTKCENDKDMLKLLYFSGLRIGEFLGIKVKNIHFLEDVVKIDIEGQRLDDGSYTTRLKNNTSYKTIYYTGENFYTVKNYILRNKLEQEDYFMNYSRTNLRRILNSACKLANLEKNTLHGFGRKSINTELYFKTGGDVKVCQTALGQSSSSLNLEHYVSKEEATKKVISTLKKLSF